jgi:AmmeMemoRadiSam system protein A
MQYPKVPPGPRPRYAMLTLDSESQTELLALARKTLEAYFATGAAPNLKSANPILIQKAGAFVSLHNGTELRGCIGQIAPDRELLKVVQECALSAAFEDFRFSPVTPGELASLTIEISVLSPLAAVRRSEGIEVGRHGLYISRGGRRGLLLPQVAVQFGWSREEFLAQTCRKAGLPESAWRDPATSMQSFEAQVFSEHT